MVVLGSILKRAKVVRWIPEDPTEHVEKVNLPRTAEFNVLSAVQVEAVAAKAPPLFSTAIIVAAYTGLRAGELRALRWRDVNFAGSSLRVQVNMAKGGELGPPKSGGGRSVPLIDDAARELDTLSRREQFTGPDDVVFCRSVGQMVGEDRFRKVLYEAMKDAGIDRNTFPAHKGFTFHDLRHTFGTMAVQVWPLHDVQAFMGHADIKTTMIYAHHLPKHDAAARSPRSSGERRARKACREACTRLPRTQSNSTHLQARIKTKPNQRLRLVRNSKTGGSRFESWVPRSEAPRPGF
jgi:integrase